MPEERDGVATWNFSATEKMSTYLTSIVAGPTRAMTTTFITPPTVLRSHSACGRASRSRSTWTPEELFLITKQGFEFYEANYGFPTPSANTIRSSAPSTTRAPWNTPGNVTLVESYVFRTKPTGAIIDRRIITILHEQAHGVVRRPRHHEVVGRSLAQQQGPSRST